LYRHVFGYLVLASLIVPAGCGPSNGLTLGRVHGRVTYKGQPIGFGDVLFRPDEASGTSGPLAMGTIAGDGTFVLSTEQPGDGAIVGTHRVGVTGLDPTPVGGSAGPESSHKAAPKAVPKDKKSRTSRPIGLDQPHVVVRGRQGFRLVTPQKLSKPETSGLTAVVSRGSNTVNIVIQENGEAAIEP
jgi:hypothetical protein